jgi:hypothetical protein
MTIDEIKELIRVVHDTGISELEVQRGDNRVRIRSGLQPLSHDLVVQNPGGDASVSALRPSDSSGAAAY